MALQGDQRIIAALSDVSVFGDRVDQVLHDHIGCRLNNDDDGVRKRLRAAQLITFIVRNLRQLKMLLERDQAKNPVSNQFSLTDEANHYVETLAEECAIAINQVRVVITENRSSYPDPKFWKSLTTSNDDGTKSICIPEFDEAEFLQKCQSASWRCIAHAVEQATLRLDVLHSFLTIVIQVAKVHEATSLLRIGNASLQNVIDCHDRVVTEAARADIANRRGEVCHFKKPKTIQRARVSYSSSESSSDDSDNESGSGSDSDSVVVIERTPRTRKSNIRQVNVTAAGHCKLNSTPHVSFEEPVASSKPSETVVNDTIEIITNKPEPPVYTEKDASGTSEAVDAIPITDAKTKIDTKKPDDVVEPIQSVKENPVGLTLLQKAPIVLPQEARLLKSTSGFGMKIKSLFRSKSSLEAEMKTTLSSDDASLAAFVINNKLYRKVPHSAFHSLEWTHMRTILSQIHDNTWFKTYSDLTDTEHKTLEEVMERRSHGGRCVKSDLVVLKVLQKNRFNAWVRLVEECMGAEDFVPQHENFRILLVIVRETECSPANINIKPVMEAPTVGDSHMPQAIRPPNPFPFNEREHSHVVDLKNPSAARSLPPGVQWAPTGVNIISERRPAINGPLPIPPPPGQLPLPGLLNPRESISFNDLRPVQGLYEADARAALTNHIAFTIRRAPVTIHPFPSPSNSIPTWDRCLVTRERESDAALVERVKQFNSRGISIIDMKLELNDFQSAHITKIVDELANFDTDARFAHRLVELSILDRELGFVSKQSIGTIVDVMHIIIQRTPKEGIKCHELYEQSMRPRPRLVMPAPPPPPPPGWCSGPTPKRSQRKRYPASDSSDSDGSMSSSSSSSSYGRRRRNKKTKSKRSSEKGVARWSGRNDPSLIIFDKALKGKNVVQCLLDRWIQTADSVEKEKGAEKIVEM